MDFLADEPAGAGLSLGALGLPDAAPAPAEAPAPALGPGFAPAPGPGFAEAPAPAGGGFAPPAAAAAARAAASPRPPALDDEATDSEGGGPPRPPPPLAGGKGKGKRGGGAPGGGRGGGITLRTLVEEGILAPGENVLTMEYKGTQQAASLAPDGRIVTSLGGRALAFDSPSAFSIYFKRLINPTRKADDGWKTVKYAGKLLETYKGELLTRRFGGAAPPAAAPRAKRPRAAGASSSGGGAPRPGSAGMLSKSAPEGADAGGPGFAPGFAPPFVYAPPPAPARAAPPHLAALGVDEAAALLPLAPHAPGRQPFRVRVHPAALAVMDFHSHLSAAGVVGALAGSWDAGARLLTVVRAFPAREAREAEAEREAEAGATPAARRALGAAPSFDAEDRAARHAEAEKAGLCVVGWYHSHPTFAARPTAVDVVAQARAQLAAAEPAGGGAPGAEAPLEPFVAAIVAPYERPAAGPAPLAASVAWFRVDRPPGARAPAEGERPEGAGLVARALAVELAPDLDGLGNLPSFARELAAIARRHAGGPDRAPLEALWAPGVSFAHKALESVKGHLVGALGEPRVRNWAVKVLDTTQAVWKVYAPAAARPGGAPPAAHELDEPISSEDEG
jgi:hypothetical protein